MEEKREEEEKEGGGWVGRCLFLISSSSSLFSYTHPSTPPPPVVLSNALYMMSKHPATQTRLRKETLSVLGGGEGPKRLKDLQGLVYAQCVVKETLRTVMGTMTWRVTEAMNVIPGRYVSYLSSPHQKHTVPHSNRLLFLFSPTYLSTHRDEQPCLIPPDTSIIVPMVAMHRQEAYWPDAEAFRPERFLEGDIGGMKDPLVGHPLTHPLYRMDGTLFHPPTHPPTHLPS